MISGPWMGDEECPQKPAKNPDALFTKMVKEIVDKYEKKANESPPQVTASQYFHSMLNELNLASWGAYGRDITGNIDQESAEKIQRVLGNKFPPKDNNIEFEILRTTFNPPNPPSYKIMVKGKGIVDPALMELVITAASAMVELAAS